MLQFYKNHLMKRRDLTALNFKLLEDKKNNQIYFRFRENILPVIGKEKLENVIMQTDSNHQKIIASYNNLLTIFIMRLCDIEP